jgi:hypothetical protein
VPWTSQPQIPIRDSGTGWAQTLVHLWGTNVMGSGAGAKSWLDAAGSAHGVFGVGSPTTTSGNAWVTRKEGYGVLFDYSLGGFVFDSKAISVGSSTGDGGPNSQAFSIVARINAPGTSTCTIYSGGPGSLQFRLSNTNLQLNKATVANVGTSTGAIPASTDCDVGMSYDGTTAAFYINGQPSGTATSAQTMAMAQQFYIGAQTTGAVEQLQDGTVLHRLAVFNSILPDAAFAALAGPGFWQLYAPLTRQIPVLAGTISRPGSDVSVTGWAFTAANLSGSINETTRDDASYAQAAYGVSAAITTLSLSLAPGSYTLSFAGEYLAATAASGQFRFTALDGSNTSLGVTAWQAVTSSNAQYDIPLTVAGGTAVRLKIEIQA